MKAKAKVVFRGVACGANTGNIIIQGGARVSPLLNVQSELADIDVFPQGKFTTYSRTIRPAKAGKVCALGERDVVPADPLEKGKELEGGEEGCPSPLSAGTRLYQLVLEYSVTLEAGAWPSYPAFLFLLSLFIYSLSLSLLL